MKEAVTYILPLIANLGLLAILAWVVSFFGSELFDRDPTKPGPKTPVSAIWIGLSFGVGAALLMQIPFELRPGLFGDGRGAPILLAGIVGGPVAAAITTVIAVLMRGYLGGVGAISGMTYITIFGLVGFGWGWLSAAKNWKSTNILALLLVATFATLVSMPVILLLPEAFRLKATLTIWPQLWLANVVGTAMLGSLIEREMRRVAAERDLARREERAIRGTEAKSRFLATMTHEIRTPLSSILAVLQLAEKEAVPARVMRDLTAAREAGQYLMALINQILDFARIEAGITTVRKDEFKVSTLFETLEAVFRPLARQKQIDLRFDHTGAKSASYYGDADKIQQVLFNLIGNAIKYTNEGRVTVGVSELVEGKDRKSLLFEVVDTGIGIPKSAQKEIFGEYFRADASQSDTKSTGLGLSISRSIAHMLGGEITVESEVGRGSRFLFVTEVGGQLSGSTNKNVALDGPASDPIPDNLAAADRANEGPEDGTQAETAVVATPARILMAEDNALNRALMRRLLEKDGHAITDVEDGLDAVEAIASDPSQFDIVLMDVEMPRMDGLEALQEIRARFPANKVPPIIALTAHAEKDLVDRLFAEGARDVLTKPIDLIKMRSVLQDALSTK